MEISEKVISQNQNVTTTYEPRSPWQMMIKRFKKNKRAMIGLYITVLFIIVAILAPWISPYDPYAYNMKALLQPPSLSHPFGTDQFGRDVLSRIIHGSRISLMIGMVGVGISILVGVSLGTIAGYFGGIIDSIIMRIMDILLAFPGFLLALAIISILGPNMLNVMIAIGIFSIPVFARIMRSSVISVKYKEFIEATKSLGGSHFFIIMKHVIPNCIAPIIVLSTMRIATAILTAAGLSFLGLGAQPPSPEWGAMLNEGREYIRSATHLSTVPGLIIMLVVLGFNMLGDGLRDALDPQMKI
ncbi:nickel transporter permease [Neobacillus kokaensis]|uniref:Peptide ABC transporter substrate-binding protein n=1 Tax=Neobacillus kokaensis TaxID=2759023 RepID=A0ABQ3N4C0_9BACI|nr:nickel transporter permease [Neobacillus kokaensis]GHH99785.1 peptide ABC transporter substrate-binding protein [Neobacillus kokaensis]